MIQNENIILLGLCNDCYSCRTLKHQNIIDQIINFNKKKIGVYHSGLSKIIPIKIDVPIISCDSIEDYKLTYCGSNKSKYFCTKCNETDITNFLIDVNKNLRN